MTLFLFPGEERSPFSARQSDLLGDRRQTVICIVDPQVQPVFGPGGEHPVRLVRALRDEIVDHDPDVALRSRNDDRRSAQNGLRRIDPGDQSLASRLFVSRRSVDLSGKEESRQLFHLQPMIELAGIDGVVFDRIAWADHLAPSQARNGRAPSAACTSIGMLVDMPFT